ncbi:hypothetical protein KR018_006893, partial [Drosophila ironensis]
MEHPEPQPQDNAQFDNYLQNNRLELELSGGGVGEDPVEAPAGLAPSKAFEQAGQELEQDEEWKYIHEVQQTEKQEHQEPANGNHGFGELLLGNGFNNGLNNGATAPGGTLLYEEEDVEVIKNEGDFSTNSNTTTSTGEQIIGGQEADQLADQLQQVEHQQPAQEDEDEPSSVATTYGTSSLSENNPAPLDQEPEQEHDQDKENASMEENHSQLNPNAVAFVPSFGSQPSSPLPAGGEPVFGLAAHLADDLVAESPRKGSARYNMDAIAVPDEREFDIEADKRPHELEQESNVFVGGDLDAQLINGASLLAEVHDHGPETSVDLDVSLEQAPGDGSDMNASIEDILNSVQPLPVQADYDKELELEQEQELDQPGGDFVAKELLNVEEKENVSQSPSTEELQFQQQLQPDFQQPMFGSGGEEDPMQASFYLEHTSSEAQNQALQDEQELPTENWQQGFVPETPEFAPYTAERDEPVAKLELQAQQADIVDITPSPLSSTAEKHLVEDTKEQQEPEEKQDLELDLEQESKEEQALPCKEYPFCLSAVDIVIDLSSCFVAQVEEYAAFNAASDYGAQFGNEEASLVQAMQGINPFAQPFTPAHLIQPEPEQEQEKEQEHEQELQVEQEAVVEQPTSIVPLETETETLAANFGQLQLQEELVEEEFGDKLDLHSQHFALDENIVAEEDNKVNLQQPAVESALPEAILKPEEPLISQEADVVVPVADFVPEEQLLSVAPVESAPVPAPISSEPLVEAAPEIVKDETILAAAAGAVAAATVAATAAVAAAKPKAKTSPVDTKKPATATASKTGVAAKPRPTAAASAAAAKKPTPAASATSKPAAARPRTAPVGPKTTVGVGKAAAGSPPSATTRKPLASNAATTAKPAPRTILGSTRPATAPVSKTTATARTTAAKPAATGTATGLGARAPARPRPATATAKPEGAATGSTTARKVGAAATGNTAPAKTRLTTAPASAPAKPKVPSPRSATGSTVRRVPGTTAPTSGSLSARSPTKPPANGVGVAKTTTSTTTTTVTKTFTARPAPKFTHSLNSAAGSSSNGVASRRAPTTTTGTGVGAAKRPSPLKPGSATARTSPLKSSSTTPLKSKAKESVPAKASPVGLKGGKNSTPLKGAGKAAEEVVPAVAPEAATNGQAKEEKEAQLNG